MAETQLRRNKTGPFRTSAADQWDDAAYAGAGSELGGAAGILKVNGYECTNDQLGAVGASQLSQLLQRLEEEVRQKQRDLEDLRHFKAQHVVNSERINQYFEVQQQRLHRATISEQQVGIFHNYKQGMLALLKETGCYLQNMEEEQAVINQAIGLLEQDISCLVERIQELQCNLSDSHLMNHEHT